MSNSRLAGTDWLLFKGINFPQRPLLEMEEFIALILLNELALKLQKPLHKLLDPAPQFAFPVTYAGTENPLTNKGAEPIFNRIISFCPSLLPSQASTNTDTISKHLLGVGKVPDPAVPHGCAIENKLNNKNGIITKSLIYARF
jgi:hypothetical protein